MTTENIFIVGCNRTGTSLLRRILNRSPHICIARETHFLRRFSGVGLERRLKRFGDLSDDGNTERLVDFMFSGRSAGGSAYWQWLRQHVDRRDFARRLLDTDRGERAIFRLLMQVYAEQHKGGDPNRLILGEKTPSHYCYVPTLLEWFPNAKIIHTFRDPRAILMSTVKKVHKKNRGSLRTKASFLPGGLLDPLVGPVELLHITQAWFDAARRHTRYARLYPRNYFLLRFEDLIGEPDKVLRAVCDFIDVPFDASLLDEVTVLNSSYQDGPQGSAGFDRQALERWRRHIHPFAQAWFSIVGRRQLKQFGYPVA
ncbi:MAG TPA: sulfotransferase [Anaerolineae bacterium]|nr:sulfotransferase [Anaerolineae bacterium]